MKVNAQKLIGAALDWAVATCEGLPIKHDPMDFRSGSEAGYWIWGEGLNEPHDKIGRQYNPSTNWGQAGPIIEREGIELLCNVSASEAARFKGDFHADWFACIKTRKAIHWHGTTPVVAAMRCYVASRLGDEIDVPASIAPSTE